METIIELAKAYERITKDIISRLDIQYNTDTEMYQATLDFEDAQCRFIIKEDGTVSRIMKMF